ncbi:MAG: helix-turn-helix transcriptional regulator [Bacteroidales bacterium]|nr:helix-turn-helix transcriptional regulator [Candidatus Liminaster caballi]
MSQERLALDADIDRRYMSDVENGKRNISLDIMERIASQLGIEVSELIRHAEEISKTPLTIDALKEWLCNSDHEDTIVLESPDYLSAIIGITEEGRLIYSYDKMVEHLMREDGMDTEEAMEFINYNTIRALPYAGEMAPIIQYNIEL